MYGRSCAPTEQPTRIAGSPGNASSTASQHPVAMSASVRPGLPFGDRPYPGMSMAMQRNQVEKCGIWNSQLDWSSGLGWMKIITVPDRPIELVVKRTLDMLGHREGSRVANDVT